MEVTGVLVTDAGMFGLWSPASFSDIVDHDTWELQLLEDENIVHHIVAGAFIPVNIGGDGAFQVVARIGSSESTATLTNGNVNTCSSPPSRICSSRPAGP